MNPKDLLSAIKLVVPEAPDISQPLTFTTATASVNMKNYSGCLACILITDAGTGSAITLNQGTTSTASTSLAFTKYYYIADVTGMGDLTAGTASSNTFTTGVASSTGLYIIPVTADMLDKTYESEDSFVRLNAASAANATGVVFYVMYGARFGGDRTGMPVVT